MALEGGERLVLKTLRDLQRDFTDYVDDVRLATATKMFVQDVRDWLETLEGKGFVERARLTDGFSAIITAKGKLELRLTETPPPGAEAVMAFPVAHPATAKTDGTASLKASESVRTILFLGANPKDTDRLKLVEEAEKIGQGLERANRHDQFKLVVIWAVTDDELRRALLDHEPEIVHFLGHGVGLGQGDPGRDLVAAGKACQGGLAFENKTGQVHLIPSDALSRLFELCSDHLKCVVLNACYSGVQAGAIAKHIDFVVGMNQAIGDEAAIKFAVGFYDALGVGKDYEKAFKFGCSAIDLMGIPEYLTPVLIKKSTSATTTRLSQLAAELRALADRLEAEVSVHITPIEGGMQGLNAAVCDTVANAAERLRRFLEKNRASLHQTDASSLAAIVGEMDAFEFQDVLFPHGGKPVPGDWPPKLRRIASLIES